jgi:hypothetical protein
METPKAGFFRLRPLDLDLGDVLVQIVAVALGVILGFAVTSWNEREQDRRLLHETVGNIVAEISANQTGLHEVLAPHARALAQLAGLVKRARKTRAISFDDARTAVSGSFPRNVPLSIAWQIAQSDRGLTLLPYDDRYGLAWVYELQSIYDADESRFGDSLLTLSESPSGNYYFEIIDLANQLKAVVSTEQQLNHLYTQTLAQAKKEFP